MSSQLEEHAQTDVFTSCGREGSLSFSTHVTVCFNAFTDHLKTEQELGDEKKILNEMLDVVEQRDALVALLEEQRLREKEEDKDLEEVMLSKGYNLNWS